MVFNRSVMIVSESFPTVFPAVFCNTIKTALDVGVGSDVKLKRVQSRTGFRLQQNGRWFLSKKTTSKYRETLPVESSGQSVSKP